MSYAVSPEANRLTVAEYLEREAVAERKHEYVAGLIYAFAGASRRHSDAVSRLLEVLLIARRATGCSVYTSDMLLRAAADVFYYPDVTVVCDPSDTNSRFVERPCLVVEVLSPSTQHKDRREKLLLYRSIESLRGYLIVAPDEGWIELHERHADGMWRQHCVEGDEKLALPCVDAAIAAHELFLTLQSEQ